MVLDDRIDAYYLRLSLEDKDVDAGNALESDSISAQRLCIGNFVQENFNTSAEHFQEFVDDGYSGTNMNRPAMKRLLKLVEQGQVRTIIVRDLSRFARNYLEAGHYLEYVFPAYGVRFISINDRFDSDNLSDSSAFEMAVRNLLNDMYSRDISKKIKSVVDLKKLNGEYVYGQAPYGYKKGSQKNTIVVDEAVSGIVKKIFTWAAKGITVSEIAQKLNDAGIQTPSVYLSSIRGKYKTYPYWSYDSVKNILINRIYTGDTVPFKSHVKRVGSKRVNLIREAEQTIIPDTHEAIISRELFWQARTTIRSNTKSAPSEIGNPLTSKLICGCCKKTLQKGKASNKNWLCPTARYTKESGCHMVRIEDGKIQTIVLDAIRLQCEIADENMIKICRKQSMAKQEYEKHMSVLKKMRRDMEMAEKKLMQLADDYYTDRIEKDEFVMLKSELKTESDALKIQIEEVEKRCQECLEKVKEEQHRHNTNRKFSDYVGLEQLDRKLVNELIKHVIIYPDSRVHIEWKFAEPFGDVPDSVMEQGSMYEYGRCL